MEYLNYPFIITLRIFFNEIEANENIRFYFYILQSYFWDYLHCSLYGSA